MRGQGKQARTRRLLAGAAVAGFAVLATAVPAGAIHSTPPPTETSGGQGLDIQGLLDLTSTDVSCPPSPQEAAAVDLDLGTVAQVDALYAKCDGTSSEAGAARADVLLSLVPGVAPALSLGLLESRCVDGVGSGSVVRLGADGILGTGDDVVVTANNTSLTVGTLLTVVLNENTTNAQGETVQNAAHITVLGAPGQSATEEIIIGQARCKAAPEPVIPEAPVALLLPLSAVALFGGAFLVLRRRNNQAVA